MHRKKAKHQSLIVNDLRKQPKIRVSLARFPIAGFRASHGAQIRKLFEKIRIVEK